MVRAVIFDLGGVLASDEWAPIYRDLAAEIKSTEERVAGIVKPLYRRWRTGEIATPDFWSEFLRQSGAELSDGFMRDYWIRVYKKWSKDIGETWEIVRDLHAKGIRLALLTNIIEPSVQANEEMGRFQRLRDIGFEALVYSYEVGCGKPCREMYETALAKLNLPAEECFYTDDKEKNVAAAKALGMHGVAFETPEKLREEFIQLGVL